MPFEHAFAAQSGSKLPAVSCVYTATIFIDKIQIEFIWPHWSDNIKWKCHSALFHYICPFNMSYKFRIFVCHIWAFLCLNDRNRQSTSPGCKQTTISRIHSDFRTSGPSHGGVRNRNVCSQRIFKRNKILNWWGCHIIKRWQVMLFYQFSISLQRGCYPISQHQRSRK